MLKEGQHYSRDEIHDLLGGAKQPYLPHKDGHVVAGCFVPKTNPEAPRVVLVGSGPETMRWAKVFCKQQHSIPVFLKRRVNRWEYVGEYRVENYTEDRRELADYGQRAGRTGLTRVLFLTNS